MGFEANGDFSNKILERGIRQGDLLSPALLNLTMDEIVMEVNGMKGYRMCKKYVSLELLCRQHYFHGRK